MPETQHPSFFAPKLQPEYLERICQDVVSVAYGALADASTENDTTWTRGTLLYGRVHGLFKNLSRDSSVPWLTLRNSTMDYTISINDVLFQVVMDDPEAPKKSYRLQANDVELTQMSLFEANPEDIVTWRLFVDNDHNFESPKLMATVVGFDINRNAICHWSHDYKAHVPVRSAHQPQAVELEDPRPVRRNKDTHTKAPNDADLT
jgi:hypothetical protein